VGPGPKARAPGLPPSPVLREDAPVSRPIPRRAFLRRSLGAAAVLPSLGALLAACARTPDLPTEVGSASPLPILPGVPVLDSELPLEQGATLRVYEWKEYLSSRVLAAFERAYADVGVRIEVESFFHIDEAVARLQDPASDFDVFFPTIDVLPSLAAAGILRPLNHDYLPNLANLWAWFREGDGPFYDPGQRFTTPYTIYSSGIGWRADTVRVQDAPDALDDPFSVFLNERYAGEVGMYDDYLEALSLGLQRGGVEDLRAASDAELAVAADFLREAVRRAGLAFTVDGAQEGLAEQTFAVHQAWSGDILSAPRYAADEGDDPAEVASALRYWSPPGTSKVVGCDLTAICAAGKSPVLAHAFLNHLLAFDVALDNFTWNGYQVPMDGAGPDDFADPSFPWHGAVPANLRATIISPEEFAAGQWLVGVGPSERARWLDQWKRVVPSR